jgi:intein-encoded DNA endonuclease-like protein
MNNNFTGVIIEESLEDKDVLDKVRIIETKVEKAYIIGVLCGDACINNKVVRFEIRKDEDFIKNFSDCFEKVYGLKYYYYHYKKRNSYVLYISSQIICSDLLGYGNFKTFTWRTPKEILESKDELIISSFLRGFCDSEGSVSKYCITVSSANRLGLKDVRLLLIKSGINNKVRKTKEGYYVITITGRERLKIFKEKIGFSIKRKMDKIYIKNDTS